LLYIQTNISVVVLVAVVCLAVLNRWELFLLYTRSKVCLVYCKLSCLWRAATDLGARQKAAV